MDLTKAKLLLEDVEGLKLEAYLCPNGVWTIGIGHTEGVKPYDRISRQEAFELLDNDLQWCQEVIKKQVTVTLNENQYNALICFIFRLGEPNFLDSTLLKVINENPSDYSPFVKVSSITQGFRLFLERDGYSMISKIHYNFIRWCWSSKQRKWLKSLYDRHYSEYRLYCS